MKLLVFNDAHIKASTPRSRIDDYPSALWEKFQQISQIIEERNIDVILNGGDLFDTPDPSTSVVNSYLSSGQDTRIAIAHLKPEIREKIVNVWFTDYFNMINNTRYDANAYSLFASVFKCLRKRRDAIERMLGTDDWLFCSELVAHVYKTIGIFPAEVEPKDVLPMDYIGFDSDNVVPIIVDKPYDIGISELGGTSLSHHIP